MAAPKEGRGLFIRQKAEDLERGIWVPDRALTLTSDGRVVEEGTESGHLFAIPGRPIPLSEARRYGLVPDVAPEVETVAAAPEVETSAPTARRRGRGAE